MKYIIFSLFLATSLAFSQKEASIWYFGTNAGMKFDASGAVTVLTDGQLNTDEGCATIADTNGNLLFYTDGTTVWNKNHQIMSNGTGLMGNWSSTQSATIVPMPGNSNLFYVFTLDFEANANGFSYSIVDMSLNSGLGAVTSNKNVLIYTPSNEKLAIVKHANNIDYWVVTHGWNNNAFYSYLLTSTGLSATPVTSNVGAIVSGTTQNVYGYMKISPDATKIAICNSHIDAEVLDFSASTGIVSNPTVLFTGSSLPDSNYAYGAEFSPDSKLLYITNIGIYPLFPRQLIQYNLSNPSNIVSSAQIIDSSMTPIGFPVGLQLAPNGKIYVSQVISTKLAVINNPNLVGAGCAFQMDVVDLAGRFGQLGLPPFVASFFYTPAIQFNKACAGDAVNFSFNTNQNILSASWDFGDGTTSNVISPSHNYLNAGTYPITVTITTPQGTGSNNRNITVHPQPVLLTNTLTLQQCDDDNNGYSAFNLNESIPLLVSNPTGLNITFHETLIQAQNESGFIANTSTYTNQIINYDVVYARVENADGCYKTALVNLQVSTTSIPTSFQLTYYECDDALSGSNTDGITTFNFSAAESQVRALYPLGQLLDVTFYKNLADALSESNKITNTSSYTNVGYPNTQNIYVRVDSQINNECLGLGHHITLQVDRIPLVQPQIIRNCDDNHDGIFGFNTLNLQSAVLNGLTNVNVTYTDQNGNPLQSPLPNPFNTTSQIVNVNVKNNYGKQCDFNATIQFIIDDLPQAYTIPVALTTACDDEVNPAAQNGSYPFNTSTFQSIILGGQTGMIVNYYDANNTPLPSPLPNPFNTPPQNITVEVINQNNNSCKATTIIPFAINPIPNINLYGNELICSDNPTFTKIINAGLVDVSTVNNYSYTWFLNNALIPNANQYALTVNTEGIYTVEVKNGQGCTSTRTLTITASNQAIINSVIVNDLADENSIIVLLSSLSLGDYLYSLDNTNYQSSNVFSNIMPGIYTIYVKDVKGCGITPKEVSVLGVPKYFTPNEDGYNDYWNIDGVNQNFYSKSTIQIFDRYGKLLKQISGSGLGWDGKYNGQNAISDDYWYVIKLEDGRIIKGNFTLKR